MHGLVRGVRSPACARALRAARYVLRGHIVLGVDVCARLQQRLHAVRLALLGRHMERGPAVLQHAQDARRNARERDTGR